MTHPPSRELLALIDKAKTQINGGICYFTAEAKHEQLKDAYKTLDELKSRLAAQPVSGGSDREATARTMALADSRKIILETSDDTQLGHASDSNWKEYLHMVDAIAQPVSGGEVEHIRKLAFGLTPAEQYRLAFFVAENVGYVLAREPEHPDSPHAAPGAGLDDGFDAAWQALERAGFAEDGWIKGTQTKASLIITTILTALTSAAPVQADDSVQQKAPLTKPTSPGTEASGVSVLADGIIIRPNPDGNTIDEVVAQNCSFHIEQMDATGFWFCVSKDDDTYSHFWVGSRNRKSHVDLIETDSGGATKADANTRTSNCEGCKPPAILADTTPSDPAPVQREAVAWRWLNTAHPNLGWTYSETEVREHPSLCIKVEPLYTHPTPDLSCGVEEIARIIYDAFPFTATIGTPFKPTWVPNGNSHMQVEARFAAQAILALGSGTKSVVEAKDRHNASNE